MKTIQKPQNKHFKNQHIFKKYSKIEIHKII